MKKTSVIIIILMISASVLQAADFSLGLFYGQRTVNDSDIKNIYGQGYIYFPYLYLNVWKGIIIGAGYEGGYSKRSTIGIFQEKTSLRVIGGEIFIGYQLKIRSLLPYFKIGWGYFAYKQTIESPYIEQYVDHKKTTITISGGLSLFLLDNLYLGAEVKYVPLKVKPYEYEVDLGGVRYMAGVGFRFDIK